MGNDKTTFEEPDHNGWFEVNKRKIYIAIWVVWILGIGSIFTSPYLQKIFGVEIWRFENCLFICTDVHISTKGILWSLTANAILGFVIFIFYKSLKYVLNILLRVPEKPENKRASILIAVFLSAFLLWSLYKLPNWIEAYALKNNCNLIFDGDKGNRALCFAKLAYSKLDPSFCEAISASKTYIKSSCFENIAIWTENPMLCKSVPSIEGNEISSGNCAARFALMLNDINLCDIPDKSADKAMCIFKTYDVLSKKLDLSVCKDITRSYQKYCYTALAVQDDDEKYCDYIDNKMNQESCLSSIKYARLK